MKILLVNDDGYQDLGIITVRKVLEEYGDVYVSAPHDQKSGASVSIGVHKGSNFTRIDEKTIACYGSPADCVYIGLYYYGTDFDLVVSGANDGYNESYDSLFSGTVGAGIAANLFGYKVLVLSADYHDTEENIERKTRETMEFVLNNHLLDGFPFLSVNYPMKKYELGRGFKLGRIYNEPFLEKVIVNKENKLQSKRQFDYSIFNEDSDRLLTANGYYSITPLRASFEDTYNIDKFKKALDDIE